jgi:hypothetical protein
MYILYKYDSNMGTENACWTWELLCYFQNNFSSYGDNKEDFSDLPPNQRKKKLQLRVEDITAKIQQETAARYIV